MGSGTAAIQLGARVTACKRAQRAHHMQQTHRPCAAQGLRRAAPPPTAPLTMQMASTTATLLRGYRSSHGQSVCDRGWGEGGGRAAGEALWARALTFRKQAKQRHIGEVGVLHGSARYRPDALKGM